MNDQTAFVIFLVVTCGGLALFTLGMLATAVALWRRNRPNRGSSTPELELQTFLGQYFRTHYSGGGTRMRVRITRRPPASYGNEAEALRVGRVYNLQAALASALMADGCAELYETLPDEARRGTPRDLWQSRDRDRPWSGALPGDDDPEN